MFSWFRREKPASCRVQFGDGGQAIELQRDEILLAAALERGIPYPHNCRVGTCGQCKTAVISGQIKPMMDFALSPLTAQELRDGYVLACQSKVRSDLVISVPLKLSERRAGHIASVQRLPGDVLALSLELDRPLAFDAGQYANLSMDGSTLARSYSFCDAPVVGGNRLVSFLIRRIPGGAFSDRLWACAESGMGIALSGPHGAMGAADVDAHAVCVAGGTGLAPVVSIVRDRLQKSASARFLVLLGIRRAEDHFASEILRALEALSPGRVQTRVIVSDGPDGSPWPGDRGLVTDLLTPELMASVQARAAFVCGAAPMVQACRERLRQHGWSDSDIHTDSFVPSGGPPS
jgi:toluene methyl-monooxygenase electron transfer component